MPFVDLDQVKPSIRQVITNALTTSDIVSDIYQDTMPWGVGHYHILTNQRLITVKEAGMRVDSQSCYLRDISTVRTNHASLSCVLSGSGEIHSILTKSVDDANAFRFRLDEAISKVRAPAITTPSSDLVSRIRQLVELNEAGTINDADFKRLVKELVNK